MVDMSKDERISEESKKLKRIFTKLDVKEKKLLEDLISKAAYMKVTLDDYEKDINENGSVELFSQSEKTEPYERERPVIRLYNTMIKNYQTIMRMLYDILKKNPQTEKGDDFEKFVKGR